MGSGSKGGGSRGEGDRAEFRAAAELKEGLNTGNLHLPGGGGANQVENGAVMQGAPPRWPDRLVVWFILWPCCVAAEDEALRSNFLL